MSVVFKKIEGETTGTYYNLVVTVKINSAYPTDELQSIQKELLQILKNANMDGNYYWVLTLLQDMMPDMETFESLKEKGFAE
jgi:hypothetical protein